MQPLWYLTNFCKNTKKQPCNKKTKTPPYKGRVLNIL
nr:MAG TPA: hypothetical protein [Caudoviricetes sp.]